jgi:hypothetical protein
VLFPVPGKPAINRRYVGFDFFTMQRFNIQVDGTMTKTVGINDFDQLKKCRVGSTLHYKSNCYEKDTHSR